MVRTLAHERDVWLGRNPEPWTPEQEANYHRFFSARVERALDTGHGSCLLRHAEYRQLITEALLHFDGQRYVQLSFVVMPNHVHSIFLQNPEWPLKKIIRSWKSFPARQINRLLGRSESLWQRDYFDRLVRDQKHFRNCVNYIRKNPETAGLPATAFTSYEHEITRAIE